MNALRAVARIAATEALRSRLALAVGLTIAVALVVLAWATTGDGTHPGKLRAFLSWGTGWVELVLSLSAVFMATALAQALRDGRLAQVLTGPLPRGLLPLGWWLGLAAVLLVLVAGAQTLTWALARGLAWRAPPGAAPALRAVLDARGVATPPPADEGGVAELVGARLAAMERAGELTGANEEQKLEVALALRQAELERRRSVPRERHLTWTVSGIRPAAGATTVALRFSYNVRNAHNAPLRGPRGLFSIATPAGACDLEGRWVGSRVHEVVAPIEVLEGQSEVQVAYYNREPGDVVIVFPERGVELLYPAGSFEGNVLRAGLVLWGRLLVLAAVAVAFAALIDGKLAALVALFVLVLGSAQGFLAESLEQFTGFGAASPVLVGALQLVLLALPDLSTVDVAGLLSAGEQIGDAAVARSLLLDGGLRAGGLLALASFFFLRRELGSIP